MPGLNLARAKILARGPQRCHHAGIKLRTQRIQRSTSPITFLIVKVAVPAHRAMPAPNLGYGCVQRRYRDTQITRTMRQQRAVIALQTKTCPQTFHFSLN